MKIVVNATRGERLETLFNRRDRLDNYATRIVMSPLWQEPGVPESWYRAMTAKDKVCAEIGDIVAVHGKPEGVWS